MLTWLGWALAVGGALQVMLGIVGWRAERRLLSRFLQEAVPGGRLTTEEDLVAVRNAVRARIRFDPRRAAERRPLLRQRPRAILEGGWGFCGENARVSVLLLSTGGVAAHRLYLFGPRWGHVVVAHRWQGAWRLFDAHDDPRTAPPDEDLGRIDVADLSAFPNAVEDNPWTASSWAKPLWGIPWLARLHPPAWLAAFTESPDLMRATVGLFLVLAGWLLALA